MLAALVGMGFKEPGILRMAKVLSVELARTVRGGSYSTGGV